MYDIFEGLTQDQMQEMESLAIEWEYTEEDIHLAEADHPIWDYRDGVLEEVASILFREAECEFNIHTRKNGGIEYWCSAVLTYHNGGRCSAFGRSTVSFWSALRNSISSQCVEAIEPESDHDY